MRGKTPEGVVYMHELDVQWTMSIVHSLAWYATVATAVRPLPAGLETHPVTQLVTHASLTYHLSVTFKHEQL